MFLQLLQAYQRERLPIPMVYAHINFLFNSEPDLIEDFKQFLPRPAAAE